MGVTVGFDRAVNTYTEDRQELEAVRIGVTRSKKTQSTNANANVNTGVKMTVAKGFRFGGSKVAKIEATLA